jgi:hypothetical protein
LRVSRYLDIGRNSVGCAKAQYRVLDSGSKNMTTMKSMKSMKSIAALVFISVFLSSCAVGTRYSAPKDGEDHAVISGDHSYIYTFKEGGCTASYSYLKGAVKIHPGVPAFINYQNKVGSNHACFLWFSFVPEAGATYKVQTSLERSEKEKASIFVPIFSGASCIAEVRKVESNGSSAPVQLNKFTPADQSACRRTP